MNVKINMNDEKMVETSLPALAGSEKQIKWAEEIRAKFIKDTAEPLDKWQSKQIAKGNLIHGSIELYGAKLAEVVARELLEEDSASFWINNRSWIASLVMHQLNGNMTETIHGNYALTQMFGSEYIANMKLEAAQLSGRI
jgi:hypothetical protein